MTRPERTCCEKDCQQSTVDYYAAPDGVRCWRCHEKLTDRETRGAAANRKALEE